VALQAQTVLPPGGATNSVSAQLNVGTDGVKSVLADIDAEQRDRNPEGFWPDQPVTGHGHPKIDANDP
jgi:hypothetical protein